MQALRERDSSQQVLLPLGLTCSAQPLTSHSQWTTSSVIRFLAMSSRRLLAGGEAARLRLRIGVPPPEVLTGSISANARSPDDTMVTCLFSPEGTLNRKVSHSALSLGVAVRASALTWFFSLRLACPTGERVVGLRALF